MLTNGPEGVKAPETDLASAADRSRTSAERPRSALALAPALESIPGLEVVYGAPLAPLTTLRIGGPAEVLATAHTQRALVALLRLTSSEGVPLHLLGLGSNVLYPDQGLDGVVARLGGVFSRTRILGDLRSGSPAPPEDHLNETPGHANTPAILRVRAGGAVPLPRLARSTASRGLLGLEAFSGFPSSVGGAVVMNAGCYGVEIKDVLVWATALHRDGRRQRYRVGDLEASYRKTALQGAGVVVATATFQLRRGDAGTALARIEELNRKRWASLPSGLPNAGSIFRNPAGDHAGRLIEAAGLKGRSSGGAQISPKHANVIVNLGDARADDVLALMTLARATVRDAFAVELEPEIVLEGSLRERWSSERAGERAGPP
ncbi:MAG TPA: UDP-N-acetylmuramate dehydrogenase [Thermoanaerobaculia bacterium]|nr:UDP-N-acetylmuramate dehydrogenase [Thermoanaerobaculia bacterium]